MPRHNHQGDLMAQESVFDVVIVGGGLSGLVTAMQLIDADPNLRLVIVEKEDYLGGQLVTAEAGELGGKWVSMEFNTTANNDSQPEVSLQTNKLST